MEHDHEAARLLPELLIAVICLLTDKQVLDFIVTRNTEGTEGSEEVADTCCTLSNIFAVCSVSKQYSTRDVTRSLPPSDLSFSRSIIEDIRSKYFGLILMVELLVNILLVVLQAVSSDLLKFFQAIWHIIDRHVRIILHVFNFLASPVRHLRESFKTTLGLFLFFSFCEFFFN